MFMDYCNGGDLKVLMDLKNFKVDPEVTRKIMYMLVTGFHDMVENLRPGCFKDTFQKT